MKNWRKTCSLFLCLVICLSLLPTSALGEEPELFPGDNGDESEYETVEGAVIGSSEEPDAAETDLNNGLADLDMADDPEENTEEYMGSNDDAEIAKDETDSPEQIVSDGFGAAETDVPDEPEVSGIEETPEVSEKQEQPEPQDEPELPADDQEVLPDETEEQDGPSLVYRNPLYEDTLSEEVLLDQDDTFELVPTAANRYTDLESAARYVRSRAVLREKSISFLYPRKNFTEETYLTIFEIALMHTGVPTEGDYLRWQYGGWRGDAKYSGDDWLITYTVTYYTTAAQEEEVNRQVAAVLGQLMTGGMSAIDKFTAIYRYISDHVTYDYDNLDNPYYVLMFTAYAALINRTAVCQGYSLLLYRMLLSAGIECRLITGYSEGAGHAWNIVRIGNVYYNTDVTWDAGRSSYKWFLLCDAHFYDHYRDPEYDTDAFYIAYPMSYTDYSPENPDPVAIRFTDVRNPSTYYYDPVYWAYGGGITTGTGATTFSPGNSCSRGQIVTFLWKAMGSPEPSQKKNPFTDVKKSDYFYKAVMWAKEQGITSGKTATTFEPYSPCTRGQIVTFLWIAKGRPRPSSMSNPFKDMKIGDYFFRAVLWAKENEITSGTSAATFSPGKTCTRAQAMTFLYKAHDIPVNTGGDLAPMELSFACSASDNTSWANMGRKFGEYLFERTDGKISVAVYASDALTGGNQIDGVQSVINGDIDLCAHSNLIMSTFDERFNAVALPYNFGSTDEVDDLLGRDGAGFKVLSSVAEEQGLHLLGIAESGFRHVTNSRHEIKSLSDMTGLKIRIPNSPMLMESYSAWGSTGVVLPLSELYTALQLNVIDGQDNTLSAADRCSISDVNKYCTCWTALYDGIYFCMNQELYDSLPSDIQALVDEAGAWAAAQQRTAARAEEQTIIERWKKAGVTFTYLSDKQVQAFKNASANVAGKWAAECVQSYGISWTEMNRLLQAFQR